MKNLELTGILVETKQYIDNSLIAKNIGFECEIATESGHQAFLSYVTDKKIAGWAGYDEKNQFLGYGFNKGHYNSLLKEGLKKKQIDEEKVWIEINQIDKFINFIAGEKFL